MNTIDDLIRPKEAVRILGISRMTLNRWTKRGFIQHLMTPSGRFLYRREDLEAFLAKRFETL